MIPLRDDNPTTIVPVVTVGLIGLNVLVFLYQILLPADAGRLLVYQYGSIPALIFGERRVDPEMGAVAPPLSLLTSMFLHGGLLHLLGNMLYLWIFGNNIEDAMGHFRFLIFYLATGVLAGLIHGLTDPGSILPAIGASGAISGVLGAYLLLYPRAQVLMLIILGFLIRVLYVPAGWVLALWFLIQLLSGSLGPGRGGGVAWWAHIGGFLAGMVLVGLFKRREVRFFNPPHYHQSRFSEW